MTKLEFLVRAFTLQNDALKSLADNQKELFHAIVGHKDRGEWVGLTDEDKQAAWDAMEYYDDFETYAKVIEAKLKEKNG